MSVDKFLDELRFLLSDLPEEEREEALDFYRCYFEDAGVENEASVMAELGSVEEVAYTIREGLKDREDEGEFTETGYRMYDDISSPAAREQSGEKKADPYEYGTGAGGASKQMSPEEWYQKRYAKYMKKTSDRGSKEAGAAKKPVEAKPKEKKRRNPVAAFFLGILKLLMVIAAICIVILLVCVLVVILGATIAAIAVTVGFLVSGIGLLAGGAGLAGVALIGISFIAFAIFLLLLAGLAAFCKNGLTAGIRGITSLTGDVIYERSRKAKEA